LRDGTAGGFTVSEKLLIILARTMILSMLPELKLREQKLLCLKN